MALNTALLREFRDKLATIDPERFNMMTFASGVPGSALASVLLEPECGTTACIAGWFCAFYAPTTHVHFADEAAAEQLGLTPSQKSELFFNMDPEATLSDAIAAIDSLLETGEIQWP